MPPASPAGDEVFVEKLEIIGSSDLKTKPPGRRSLKEYCPAGTPEGSFCRYTTALVRPYHDTKQESKLAAFGYQLVDVFAKEALSGNGLTVFQLSKQIPAQLLQRITQEMRQFESIFLWRTADPHSFRARIFTMEEELGFAGHPIIGAACALHAEYFASDDNVSLQLQLPERTVKVDSRRIGSSYQAEMDQGSADFKDPIKKEAQGDLLSALNLSHDDLMEGLPIQVVSTGLSYLIVPIKANLAKARIVTRDFESLLERLGARFVYVLDVPSLEGRTWDNDGRVEDIATGSAAGPAGAFLVAHKLRRPNTPLVIHQGRFLGRPSVLNVVVYGELASSVRVSGEVVFVGRGHLNLPDRFLQMTDTGSSEFK